MKVTNPIEFARKDYMKKLKVIYQPTGGHFVSDGMVKEFAKNLIDLSKDGDEIKVSSELIINEFRIAHMYGKVEVTVSFEGKDLQLNKTGRFAHWPDGFCGLWDHQLVEILSFSPTKESAK